MSRFNAMACNLFQGQLNDLMDASEEWMRREIEKMPDGEYYGESVTEFNGEHTARLTIRVKGSEIEFDFSGTDEQVEGYINGIYATTHAAVLAIAFMLVDPLMPHNSGSTRPIRIQVPTGTFLNANYPAATVRGNITCNDVVPDCIIRALEQAVPERMFGAWRRVLQPSYGRDRSEDPASLPERELPELRRRRWSGGSRRVE